MKRFRLNLNFRNSLSQAAGLVLMVVFVGQTDTALADVTETWPQFGGASANFRLGRSLAWRQNPPTKRWQQQLGPGMSGVVIDMEHAYSIFLKPFSDDELKLDESARPHREVVVAFGADDGKPKWRCEYDAGWIESQQAFGGRMRAPQATPLVCGDYLVTIGFTGVMHCFERASGEIVWRQNLVGKYDAIPVQFGFSASPVSDDGSLFVLSGGEGGGLVAMDVDDGETKWKVPCKEASYATPVIWNRHDGKQCVFVTRNRVVGVAAKDGSKLWEYRLPEGRLTNVPTPLPVGDKDLVLSGQGMRGTRRIAIEAKGSRFEVREVWKSNEQFFYCNWLQRDGKLLGCDGKLLLAIDLKNGATIGRYRGYNDANLLLAGTTLFAFHGDGHLSRLRLERTKMTVLAKYQLLDERCWTPPTLVGDFLYCRGGEQLLCVDLGGGDERAAVVPVRARKSELPFKGAKETLGNSHSIHKDAKMGIVEAYEKDGDAAAWNQLAAPSPSALKTIAKNGLTYLQFSLRNTTGKTIQAVVRGPGEHPFGYGLPIRSGSPRLEDWPVGTKLYRTKQGLRSELLLTVEEDFAGRVIDVPRKSLGGAGKE